jgi:hypothetical protein
MAGHLSMNATFLLLSLATGAPPDDELARAAVAVEVAKLSLRAPGPGIKQDPYRMEYAAFHAWIRDGGRGVLVVGIPDRYVGSYETHCWVPSGFGGLRNGEWDCFGKNEMTPRKSASAAPEVAPVQRPFPAGAGVHPLQTAGHPFARLAEEPPVVRFLVPLSSANCSPFG